MNVFRISRTKYINDLSGEGAKLYGGRWNRPGVAMLYTSQARSLAMLELIVHLNASSAFNLDYSFISLKIPDESIMDLGKKFYKDVKLTNGFEEFWKISDSYFSNQKLLALRVPSIIIPEEFNILLNPTHRDFVKVQINEVNSVVLDRRLKF